MKGRGGLKRADFKAELIELLGSEVDGLTLEQKLSLVRKLVLDIEKSSSYSQENKGKPWTDDELRLVLSFAPTKANTLHLAKALRRGYGSVEQIFRWAAQSRQRIINERPDDSFVQQILRIRGEVGWRSVGGDS